jgi:hypothetical protein
VEAVAVAALAVVIGGLGYWAGWNAGRDRGLRDAGVEPPEPSDDDDTAW